MKNKISFLKLIIYNLPFSLKLLQITPTTEQTEKYQLTYFCNTL